MKSTNEIATEIADLEKQLAALAACAAALTNDLATEIAALKIDRRTAAAHAANGSRNDWSDADADNLTDLEKQLGSAAAALAAYVAACAAYAAANHR